MRVVLGADALNVTKCIVLSLPLLNNIILLLLLADRPWHVSRAAVPTCDVVPLLFFSDTCETTDSIPWEPNALTPSLVPSWFDPSPDRLIPSPNRPIPSPDRPIPSVHRRDYRRRPAAFAAIRAVGSPDLVVHDDRVTDHRRRLQQIRQGEWIVSIFHPWIYLIPPNVMATRGAREC